ncbi:MAG: hypothetical protein PHY73_02230 [Candidatus Omnitrophica bacterium]|nr:hypothetical protein [Candidatus Omnitrophota bacterium]
MKKKFFSFLKFLVPLSLLAVFLWPILSGKKIISNDTYGQFAIIKFFLANINSGVFPLWNPIAMWGCPFFVENCYFSAYNPIWLFILVLNKIGINYYFSFLIVWILYYCSGIFAFYLFSKIFFRSSFLGYISFLLLLFSTLSLFFFFHANYIFIYIPSIWFFYFYIRFLNRPSCPVFMGLIFCLMIIATTYLPAYWIMFFFVVFVLSLIIFFRSFKKSVLDTAKFIRSHFVFVLFCIFLLGVACLPPLKTYLASSEKQVIFHERHMSKPEEALVKGAKIDIEKLMGTSFEPSCFLTKIFPKKKNLVNYNSENFYIPIFAYILLGLGLLTPITRRNLFLGFLSMVFFFIMIGPFSPLYQFMFTHLIFLKVIHGVSLFHVALLISLILLAVENFRLILKQKYFFYEGDSVFVTVLVHGCFGLLLFMQGTLFVTSYVTVFLSCLFFISVFLKNTFLKKFRIVILFLCILLQPMAIFTNFTKFTDDPISKSKRSVDVPLCELKFSYERPRIEEGGPRVDEYSQYFNSLIDMSEYPKVLLFGAGMPAQGSYFLSTSVSPELLADYLKYRFFLYDFVEVIKGNSLNLKDAEMIFKKKVNLALVSLDSDYSLDSSELLPFLSRDERVLSSALFIDKGSDKFEVVYFDANTIKIRTDFEERKFLVYNDSYLPDWHVFVNGEEKEVFRSNIAFKGVVLPAGKNFVEFKYMFLGDSRAHLMILTMFSVFFLVLIFSLWNLSKKKK